ncbi:hypothetical protein CU633_17965 [Bacillus sp. V3-13]|nr:hypothetical protein CU633_17965 [Bacillus sp. V3-13]
MHSPTPLAQTANNVQELIALIKQNNTNSACTSTLSANTIDLEGYSFPTGEPAAEPEAAPASVPAQAPKSQSPAVAAPAAAELKTGTKYSATLSKCVDGDTAHFIIDGNTYKSRFLYIDTPESTNEIEPYGQEASDFTCSFLNQGNITLETDGSELYDKYDRLLVWVWVNDKLHQEEITKAGLVEDFYDYGSYKYEAEVNAAMQYAKSNYTGMYASLKPAEESKPAYAETSAQTEQDSQAIETNEESRNDSDKSKDKQQELTVDEEVDSEMAATEEEVSDAYAVTGLIVTLCFFLLPWIKRSIFGVNPIIAHRLRARRWFINVFLFVLYASMWWLVLIVIFIELIHLFKTRRRLVS